MNLNPVIIVLSVLMWGWMWGIPGALLAVPILVAVKTWCDRVQSLQVFGEFLGGKDRSGTTPERSFNRNIAEVWRRITSARNDEAEILRSMTTKGRGGASCQEIPE